MKILSDNLKLSYAELNNCKYNGEELIPTMYLIFFDFYGHEYQVFVSPESLNDEFPSPASVEGGSELFDSFETLLDDDDFGIWAAIKEECAAALANF